MNIKELGILFSKGGAISSLGMMQAALGLEVNKEILSQQERLLAGRGRHKTHRAPLWYVCLKI